MLYVLFFVHLVVYSIIIKFKSDKKIAIGNHKVMIMLKMRDRYMVDNSGRIIAVYDERSNLKSGTYRTLSYAKERDIEIKQIHWMDFL